jgi:hypothetical protein
LFIKGCGLEMPDWFDEKNLSYFRQWSGEVRLLQNIIVKRKAWKY